MILCLFCNFVNVVHAHHRSMTHGRSGNFEPSPRPTDSDPLFFHHRVVPAIPCRYMDPLSSPRNDSVLVEFLSRFYKHLQPLLRLPFSNPSLAHLSPPFISLRS